MQKDADNEVTISHVILFCSTELTMLFFIF